VDARHALIAQASPLSSVSKSDINVGFSVSFSVPTLICASRGFPHFQKIGQAITFAIQSAPSGFGQLGFLAPLDSAISNGTLPSGLGEDLVYQSDFALHSFRPARGRPPFLTLMRLGILLLLCVLASRLWASQGLGQTVHIGVFAFRSIEQTHAQWAPTITALQAALPGHHLTLRVMAVDALTDAITREEVDFVLTQPEHYVRIRFQYGLSAIATLMPIVKGSPVNQFGGVIFVRADRTDIRTLQDVRGKRVVGTYEQALGAYRMQQWTLYKAGIRLPSDVRSQHFTGPPQDKTVMEVLEGKADVGFVRTGVLESMARDGKLMLSDVFVLNQQGPDVFPLLLSTELYPEWAFVARRGLPDDLVKAVTLALLSIEPDSEAAIAGRYYGFSPPGDYAPIEAMLQRLRVDPGRLDGFDLSDILNKYALHLGVFFGALLFASVAIMVRLQHDRLRLRRAGQERSLLLSSLGEGVYGVDTRGLCTFINPAALNMLEMTEADVIGKNQHDVFHHHYPDGRHYPSQDCPIFKTVATGQEYRGEEWFFRRSGTLFPVLFTSKPLMDPHGRPQGAVVSFQDISDRKKAEEEQRLAAVAFETQEGIVITDAHSRILRVNNAFTQLTGYTAQEALGQTPAMLKSGKHDEAFYRRLWSDLQKNGRWQGEIWNRRKNGEIYPEWLTITAVQTDQGAVCHYVAAFLDISERKASEARLEYLTLYDSLTDLPNRRLFNDRLHQSLANSARTHLFSALLFIDLDNFRHINDTMGHTYGDAVLLSVSERLQAVLGPEVTLARLGGDDFIILFEALGRDLSEVAAHVEQQAEGLLETLAQPHLISGLSCHCCASIGINLFMGADANEETVIRQSELAMYQAKESGRNTVRFFDPTVQDAVIHRMNLESDLRQALRKNEFTLFYQPQVSADNGIIGAEALLRWKQPVRGWVSPGLFIPLAERSGLILPIGAWVLKTACMQLAIWASCPVRSRWTLAVNISARQFHLPDFVAHVRQTLRSTGANPLRLKLELTESQLIEDVERTIQKMEDLRGLGLSLSLDDFGTGYSSLAYLQRLPLSQLKIDQSFVRDLEDAKNSGAIVQAIIAMARSLKLDVIAEGVETPLQKAMLKQWGCEQYQGYYFHRPMPLEQLDALCDAPLPDAIPHFGSSEVS
jgi:diguanylate cyclase (GGDEF)-like protein/PAS domain S-box-containing protein